MRRFAQHILICATLCFSLLACNVHQWPDAADVVEVDLHLEFNETIEPLTTVNRASEFSATSYDDYDIRYIIRAYKIKDNGYLYSEPVDYGNDIFINPVASGDHNYDAKIFLPPGKYTLSVTGINMILNFVCEYLYQRFVVFKDSIDSNLQTHKIPE